MQALTGSWRGMTNETAPVSFLGLQVNVFIFLEAQKHTVSDAGHIEL